MSNMLQGAKGTQRQDKIFVQNKLITELLEKGLIEPSKGSWACHAFVVNKHSDIKGVNLDWLSTTNPSMQSFRK